ncbi:MAG: hypothetical protein PUC32_00580 [Oscillospiraceae bacterium]|nr:hypothetical protein [Oscillospiraceae bacterium]
MFRKSFPQTGKWELILREQAKKRAAQRVSLLTVDANPDPDYRHPHNLLLLRTRGTR